MSLAEIMAAIEGHRFAAEVNLAAGTRTFERVLRSHRLFGDLVEALKESHAQSNVVQRVKELADIAVDKRYENALDSALSAYLMALREVADPDILKEVAAAAAGAPNCWWTIGISRDILVHAVATGVTEARPIYYVDASVMAGADWQESIKSRLSEWFKRHTMNLSGEISVDILRALEDAQRVQRPTNVIEMPKSNVVRPVGYATIKSRRRRRPISVRGRVKQEAYA